MVISFYQYCIFFLLNIVILLLLFNVSNKNNYNIKFSISNVVRVHSITNYSPLFLFYNNNEELTKEIQNKMKISQFKEKKNVILF